MPQRRANFQGVIPLSIQNKEGATLAKNLCVGKKAATAGLTVDLPATSLIPIMGVTLSSISDNAYGDIQTHGIAVCTSGAAVAAGAVVMADAAGKVITYVAAAGNSIAGTALHATAGADEEVEILLAGLHAFNVT